ncbi:ABC-2 type transport system permease protein [Tistlia consotensis]|uniref:ABC-2 type transport system permease protein n=1 Tax=Tistlia consotensis USBA 355 TaxID=560819 RepID=A0A1Y6CMT8_9PROT|nr:ABC transporter permease subunit [Tistlia consotensis]SMF76994.1 ABC-2 type transport system permease protein [Tistlia consotensis USBA 355]SNS13762.1 ABC-2 type transport system permease protein [Tistlia consotensis]
MRREGSPWTGLSTIAVKEAADHLTSARMLFAMALVVLTAIGSVYGAIGQLKTTVGEDPFLFLRLFTTAQDPLPSFVGFLSFLLPLVAIALAFDAINGEYQRRTMSRLLAQPIYRDALLAGKFLGGLLVLGICVVVLWLLVTGMGILLLGLPPSGEEILRGLGFLVVSLAFSAVWLAIALWLSSLFRSPATSALAALSLWLLFSVFWPMLTPLVAGVLVPLDPLNPMTAIQQFELQHNLSRLSPNVLYGEMLTGLLHPSTRSLGILFRSQMEGALVGTPLPFSQSLLIIWPDFSALVAGIVVVFTLGYVSFQRQEVRA